MAARDEESDLESDWTFVDRTTIESVETRQGLVFYSKRTASQSSDGSPCPPHDAVAVTAEGTGGEAEFEVLAHFPAHAVPDSNSSLCKDGSVVAVADDLIDQSSLTADIPSVSSADSSEASCSLDDGIMIISNHFSPSLKANHDNSHSSLQMSSSFCGWQELPQLTESGTYSLTDEPCTSDDEAGIVTISDEVEDRGIEFVHLGQHERADEDSNVSEQSDSSSFVFDSELFDISEDLEGLDLSESSDEVDTVTHNHPEDHAQSVGANDEYKRNGDEAYVDNDNGGDDDGSDGEEEKEEELGSFITVDAPTLVLLLCLTTALGFSVGHGLNVYLSSRAAGNSSPLKRPGPDTASLQYQRFTLKLPEDNVNQEHVWLWKEKEASIALMFDLKELHSKLQKEHFSLLKSHDNMKNRLHVSKVMAWYWRWKFEHERVVSENSTWNKALEKQVERLEVLYVREKRLADLWRNMKEKEARDTLSKYWKTRPYRWNKSGAQTITRRPTHKLNLEKNSRNPDDSDGVCSKFPIDFKRRWTQDARVSGPSHALTQHRIAVSNGQEMRVFVWDETRMKSTREDPAKDESLRNFLVIYQPGSLVKDVILNPNIRVGSVDIPLSLRLIMEDGSVKDFANSKEHESAVVVGEEELRVQIVKDKKLNNGDQAKQSASLHTESESSRQSDTKAPAASDGDERNEIRVSRHDQEQLDRRALLKKGGVKRGVLGPPRDRGTCEGGHSEIAVEKGRVVTSKPKERHIRKPCFEKPVKSSERKGQLEQRKQEDFTLANETIPEIYRKLMKEREAMRKALENETRKERLVRRKQRLRREDLRRHVRNAGRILQVLYRERRRMRRQKVQLRHEKFSVETAKKKLDAGKEQHEQSKDDVKKLMVQLKMGKERAQKWHKEEEKKFKQSLSMAIKKLERDRRRCEREKRTELRQIKNRLSKERKKLKSDYRELNSLKKAVRKEYKKWLRELRQVRKEGKKARGRNKPEKRKKNEKQRHRYERYKHKERDKRKIKNKSKKKGKLDDIVQENAPSKPESFEKEETKKNLRGTNKPHQKEKGRHQYEANKRREKDQDEEKTKAGKEKKCRNDMVASFNLMEKVSSEESIHAEKGTGRESTGSDKDEQSNLTHEGQHWDYRKQLEQLRQWLLQIEEQKLDQQQLQKDYTKQLRNVQKHCLKQAATEQRSNKPENTAVQPETTKAVAGFTNFSLHFSPSKVQETEEKYTSTERRKKISTEDTDSTEALARLVEIGFYTASRYTPVPVPNTSRSESTPPEKSCFKSETRRRKHEASSEVLEHNKLKPRPPDVGPYPTVGRPRPDGPIPPDKLRKSGSYMDLDQGQRFDDESFRDRWLNRATEQESCFSRVPNLPDGGPIPPEGFTRVPNPTDGGPIPPEGIRRPYGPWRHGDESWYMRRAKEREVLRKCNSFQTDKQGARNPSSWIFERANDRTEQRSNREPWYERRAEGRDEWRARHGQDAWLLERGYYRKMMNYMSDWHEGWVARGTTKRRGCLGE